MNNEPMYYLMKGSMLYEGYVIITYLPHPKDFYIIQDILRHGNWVSIPLEEGSEVIKNATYGFNVIYQDVDYDKVMERGLLEIL